MKSLNLTRPHLLIMTGLPGSGKSFFAEKFSATFGAPLVSDAPLRLGQDTPSEEVCQAAVEYQLEQLLLTKAPVIIDSFTATARERSQLISKAKKAGYQPLVVWVQTDEAAARQRSTRRRQSNTQRRYSLDEFEKAKRRFTAPSKREPVVVISGKHTYASQAKVVLGFLASNRPKEQRIDTGRPRIRIR